MTNELAAHHPTHDACAPAVAEAIAAIRGEAGNDANRANFRGCYLPVARSSRRAAIIRASEGSTSATDHNN